MRMSHQCNNFHCLASLARGAGTFPSLLPHSRCRKSFEIFSSFDYYFTFFTNFINQKLVIMTSVITIHRKGNVEQMKVDRRVAFLLILAVIYCVWFLSLRKSSTEMKPITLVTAYFPVPENPKFEKYEQWLRNLFSKI